MQYDKYELLARKHLALSCTTRIKIIMYWFKNGVTNVSNTAINMGLTQSMISHHSGILQKSGIIGKKRNGPSVDCFIKDVELVKFIANILGEDVE